MFSPTRFGKLARKNRWRTSGKTLCTCLSIPATVHRGCVVRVHGVKGCPVVRSHDRGRQGWSDPRTRRLRATEIGNLSTPVGLPFCDQPCRKRDELSLFPVCSPTYLRLTCMCINSLISIVILNSIATATQYQGKGVACLLLRVICRKGAGGHGGGERGVGCTDCLESYIKIIKIDEKPILRF